MYTDREIFVRLDDLEESQHVEDRRGGFGGRSLGLCTVALVLVAMYFGVDPQLVLNLAQQTLPMAESPQNRAESQDPKVKFVSQVLWSTEKIWQQQLSVSRRQYTAPNLQLFSGMTSTACGQGQSAMGPFYCPADQKVYIDLSFYQALQDRFKAPGDFAQAYVIAHEVGHHVQNLLGTSAKVQKARQQAGAEAASNAYLVKLELQADCYAGVWAYYADQQYHVLEPGDVEEALQAAAAIGDDTLQKQAQGDVVPDSFTHGSAEQRVYWFKQGLQSGDLNSCNPFNS